MRPFVKPACHDNYFVSFPYPVSYLYNNLSISYNLLKGTYKQPDTKPSQSEQIRAFVKGIDISSHELPSPVLDPKQLSKKKNSSSEMAETYKPKNIGELRASFQTANNDNNNNPIIVDSKHRAINNDFPKPSHTTAADIQKAIKEPPPPIMLEVISSPIDNKPTTTKNNTNIKPTIQYNENLPRQKPDVSNWHNKSADINTNFENNSNNSNNNNNNNNNNNTSATKRANFSNELADKINARYSATISTTTPKPPQKQAPPPPSTAHVIQHPSTQKQQQKPQQQHLPPPLNLDVVEHKSQVIISPSGREIKSILSKTKKGSRKKAVQFSNFVDVGIAALPPSTASANQSKAAPEAPPLPPKASPVPPSNNQGNSFNGSSMVKAPGQLSGNNQGADNINSIVDQINSSPNQFSSNYGPSAQNNNNVSVPPHPRSSSKEQAGGRREALVQAKQKFNISSTDLSNKLQLSNAPPPTNESSPGISNNDNNRPKGLSWFSDRPSPNGDNNGNSSIDERSQNNSKSKQNGFNSIPAY